MAGIYIHVPYCKTRCIYCDFYTQTSTSSQSNYVDAACRELELRRSYLADEPIHTIYFGGGTPSQLGLSDFEAIFAAIQSNYTVGKDAEITIEANPDDLSEAYLLQLRSLPINRLSIGIQSFDDKELAFLKRRHSAQHAKDVIARCLQLGFDNISIDLMYGLPNQTMDVWMRNLDEAIALDVQHISAYHLIYEERTKLFKLLKQGDVKAVDEELSVGMFSTMIKRLGEAGFEHYEISNFARDGLYSQHNTSYWQGVKYLGIGPAAHSYNGVNRAWNVASIRKYVDGIAAQIPDIEIEEANMQSVYNDFILTRMRTMWGVPLAELKSRFGDAMLDYCLRNVQKHIASGAVVDRDGVLKLSSTGIFVSDGVMSDLMWVD